MYYQLQKEKQIPTLLAVMFLFLIVVAISTFFEGRNRPISIKAGEVSIEKMEVTNCSSSSCSLVVTTAQNVKMWIIYGRSLDKLNLTVSDVRDLEQDKKLRKSHYFEIKNLEENTKYFCSMITDKGVVGKDCQFETSPSYTTLPANLKPAVGQVFSQEGKPVKGAIVLLKLKSASSLSTLTGDTGGFIIPFYPLTLKDTFQLFQPTADSKVTIEVITEDGVSTKIIGNFKDLEKLASRNVVIGEDILLEEADRNVLSAQSVDEIKKVSFNVIYPKEDAIIAGNFPLFKGTATPGKRVKLELRRAEKVPSQKILSVYTTYSDKSGLWTVTLAKKLDSGKYDVNVVSKDRSGKELSLKRSFNILKSGESVLGEATPEATLTVTTTPTLSPTGVAATTTPTVSETETPIPTVSLTPTPSPPESGLNITPFIGLSFFLIVIGFGLILLF